MIAKTVSLRGRGSGNRIKVGLVEEDHAVQSNAEGTPVWVPVYDDRYLDYIVDWIKHQIDDGWDVPILYTGERRGGKTTAAARIARKIDPEFPVGNVSFRIGDFRKVIKTNPRPHGDYYPQAWLDEAAMDLYKGDFMMAIQKSFVKRATVIGSKRQVWHIILPHFDFLSTKVAQGVIRLWIDVDLWKGERGYMEVREGIRNKWKINRFWNPWAVCLYDKVPDDDPWWLAYTKVKDTFVDTVLEEEDEVPGGKKALRSKHVEQRDRAIQLLQRSEGVSHSKLAQELDMPTGTVSRILSRANGTG